MNKKIHLSLLTFFLAFSLIGAYSLPTFASTCLNGSCTPHTTSYPIYGTSGSSYSGSSAGSSSHTQPTSSCSGSNCTPHPTSYPIYTTTTTTKPPCTTTTTTKPPVTTTTTTKPPCCQPIVIYPVHQIVTPTLDFWADKYTINQGESVYLHWSSSYVNYCVASLGWSGPKSTNGFELVSPESDTTYSLTCYGNNGTLTRNLTIKVNPRAYPVYFGDIALNKLGRNLSRGERTYSKTVSVKHSEVVEFYITLTNNSSWPLENIVIKDILPSVFKYLPGTTKINGVGYSDGIASLGLNLGTLNPGETKTITFQAQALTNYGTYTNTAQVTGSNLIPKTETMTLVFPAVIDASTVKTGTVDGLTLSLVTSSVSSGGIFYLLKFNPKGKTMLLTLEERIRNYALNKERKKLLKK